MTEQQTNSFDMGLILEWLKSQDYRVTRPFTPLEFYCDEPLPSKLLKAAILEQASILRQTSSLNLGS